MTSFNKAFFIGLPLIITSLFLFWYVINNEFYTSLYGIMIAIIFGLGMRIFFKNLAHHLDSKREDY